MAVKEGGKYSMLDAALEKMRMENRVNPGLHMHIALGSILQMHYHYALTSCVWGK